ncbi:AMP nucleosidase [Corynebacterium phocae]|uniref:AMP nucleosidase n=1 Tax=Corynebacterium phocae TaxID=161895 RepID=A0A1L7D0X9_9CORY|nr:AMP nucleosidase [Corynebacterium phocae]APT91621.1 AMP nucleosidase [Corynebacterium phocae]KAA8720699.1 AMP nucleosidase [Corynebacterium phocae]
MTSLSAGQAVAALIEYYDRARHTALEILENGNFEDYGQVVYPRLTVEVKAWVPIDRSEPFGYVDEAGRYTAVISKPHLMRDYLEDQLTRLSENYDCTITVAPSEVRIPPEYIRGAPALGQRRSPEVPRPTLDDVNDAIINGDWDAFHGTEKPLFHFGPQRFDIACARIEHYTGVEVDTVQKYILFTNYAMHTTEFLRFGLRELVRADSRYTALVLPNGETLHSDDALDIDLDELTLVSRFQMPRFDLITAGGDGITMINIGVGPSNAKTITDCLAVLRPEAWIMIGHCAGLDGRMRMGDLILGNAYQRNDHILNPSVHVDVPIPAIPEVQRALEASVHAVYGENQELMRTGTVISTADRNWEWRTSRELWEWLRASTAVAVDMESSLIAANGYRFRVPYGTLLSVSDLPLHAVPKLPAAAQAFYSNSKEAHVMCAVRAVEALAGNPKSLHTRKLRRTIGEVPFR